MKNILAIFFTMLIGLGFSNTATAQVPGTYDLTFANNGELSDSPAIFPFRYSGMALSPGGEFVITSVVNSNTVQAIRYTAAGDRDILFGTAGLAQTTTTGFAGSVTTSIVQTDLKILVGGQFNLGSTASKSYLLRLNSNGTPDSTFGTNGWVLFNLLPRFGECIHQVSLQNNGQIVALDMGNNPGNTDTFYVVRLNTNGTYDNTFAGNGRYQVPFNNFLYTSPNIFTIDANNNFTFAGYSNYLSSDYLYLFRLNGSGVLDQTYGANGSTLIDSTNIIDGGSNLGLCFQNDGKLLTVQSKQTGTILWAVCRYNTDGSIDQSFGTNGLVNVQPNLYPVPYAVENIAVTSTDQIIVAGVVTEAGSNRTIVCSINSDGSTDVSFGNNQGSDLLNCFERDDIVYNLLIEPNNEIMVNGLVNETNNETFEVVKLLAPSETAGIKPVNNSSFSVYPNPTADLVYVGLPATANGKISVTDIAGKVVLQQLANQGAVQTLSTGSLAAGVYIISYKDAESCVSEKIVKQ